MTALEYLRQTRAKELAHAKAEYRDCVNRGLKGMAAFWRRQMVRSYIYWRWVR